MQVTFVRQCVNEKCEITGLNVFPVISANTTSFETCREVHHLIITGRRFCDESILK